MIKQPFYGRLIQHNPGEPVLSHRDLLEQPLDFYEPFCCSTYNIKALHENPVFGTKNMKKMKMMLLSVVLLLLL